MRERMERTEDEAKEKEIKEERLDGIVVAETRFALRSGIEGQPS